MTSVFGIVGNKNFLFFPSVIKGKCKWWGGKQM